MASGTEKPFCTIEHIDVNGTERIFGTVKCYENWVFFYVLLILTE